MAEMVGSCKTASIMKTILPLIISAVISTSAFADVTLIQDTLLNGISSRTTMMVKGDKVRSDNGTATSIIMDTANGDMITLMHEQKMMIKNNTKELQALAAPAKPNDKIKVDDTKVTATGKTEKVDGYDCEIYLSENNGMVVKMWLAKNYPGQEKLREELKVMTKLSAPGTKQPEIPGLALKTEYEQQGLKFTTRLISISSDKIDDAKFAIPADYKAP